MAFAKACPKNCSTSFLPEIRGAYTIQIKHCGPNLHENATTTKQVNKAQLVQRSVATHPNHDQKQTVLLTNAHPDERKSHHLKKFS
jgi:hypothetical protein